MGLKQIKKMKTFKNVSYFAIVLALILNPIVFFTLVSSVQAESSAIAQAQGSYGPPEKPVSKAPAQPSQSTGTGTTTGTVTGTATETGTKTLQDSLTGDQNNPLKPATETDPKQSTPSQIPEPVVSADQAEEQPTVEGEKDETKITVVQYTFSRWADNNDNIAQELGLEEIALTPKKIVGEFSVYEPGVLPKLEPGEVLIQGKSRSTSILNADGLPAEAGNFEEIYYRINKEDLPEDYILSGRTIVHIGDIPANKRPTISDPSRYTFPIPEDDNFMPVYNIRTREQALKFDAERDAEGKFRLKFKDHHMQSGQTVLESSQRGLLSDLKNADITLKDFGDYGRGLRGSPSQQEVEKKLYTYVNDKIQFNYSWSNNLSTPHTIAQAVACGKGICRDKAAALEYGLEAAGITADQIVSDQHVFVVVYNNEGKADHYLDPMYYETYLPLQRTNLSPKQIIPHTYDQEP